MSMFKDKEDSRKAPEAIKPVEVIKPIETPKPAPEKSHTNGNNNTLIAAVPVDVYVTQIASSQPSTLEELEVKAELIKPGKNRLSLPNEVEALFKKKGFTGRWIYKHKQAIDHALRQRGWALATKVYFPQLPDHLFSATGVIENGDSILGFMPEKRALKLRTEPGRLSMEKVKNLPIEKWKDGGDQYYKPSLSEEKDGEEVTSGVQPDRKTD